MAAPLKYWIFMGWHDSLLLLLAILSEFIGTLSGFGSSTFFVPIAVFLESFGFVLALTAILHCFGNLSKIFLFRENLPKKLLFQLGIPSIACTAIGALLSARVSVHLLTHLLGTALICISLLTLFKRQRPRTLSLPWSSFVCGLSGLMTGLVGTGGALRGLALSALQVEKSSFVALSAAIDLGGDLLRAGIYISAGYMDWNQWPYIPALGVAAVGGAIAGKLVLKKMNQNQFEKIVAFFVLVSGIGMLIS